MKKVAILSNSFPPIPGGGIESANYNLYSLLKKAGYDVKVYTYLDYDLPLKYVEKDINVLRFGAKKIHLKIEKYRSIIKRKFEKWILNKPEPDVYSYQYRIVRLANLSMPLINFRLKRFNPDVIFIPDFGAPGYSLTKLQKAKYIHISHHNPARFINNPLFQQKVSDAMKAVNYEQQSLSKIDKVICVSNHQKEMFDKTFHFKKPVNVIPNIIDESFIVNIKKVDIHNIMGINESYPIVYIPSAGSKAKGEKYVVEIVRRVSALLDNKVGFYLSGGLSLSQEYEFKVLNKFNLWSPGFVDYSTNISYIKGCTICVSPTLMESFGMALLEAMFCNLPCVSFNIGGVSDIIEYGEDGFSVPLLDVEELIKHSVNLLVDGNLRTKIKAGVQKKINRKFSSKSVINKYLELIEDV